MSYILYSYPDCASHVVRMVLEEIGAEYRDEIVQLSAGSFSDKNFLRLNPRGMVPVLADVSTGATLSETGAILSFLAEQSGRLSPDPSNAMARALYLQRIYFLSNTLHADAQIQYYTKRYVGEQFADSVRPMIHDRMRSHFQMLDSAIAEQGGPWLLGAQLSVCDFYLGGCVRWSLIAPSHAPLEPEAIKNLPHLSALLQRLEARDSVQRAFDAEDTPRSRYFTAPVRSNLTVHGNRQGT